MTEIPWVRNAEGKPGRVLDLMDGCQHCSLGCENCWAARLAGTRLRNNPRFAGLAEQVDGKYRWTGEVRLRPEAVEIPFRTNRPTTWFVCSKSDLFHQAVPDQFILDAREMARRCARHIFLFLTKRPWRMVDLWAADGMPDNAWIGVSVETQQYADERIPNLLRVPAAVRFVSAEPLLASCNLIHYLIRDPRVNWVIAGCESGGDGGWTHPDWFRSLRDQCLVAGVPFFLKQGRLSERTRRVVHMPYLDGVVWDQMPAAPACSLGGTDDNG